MKLFQLQFSQQQQSFHLEPIVPSLGVDVPIGDWITICESISDIEFRFFMCYIENIGLNMYTNTNVQYYFNQAKLFHISLFNHGIKVDFE